MWNPFKKIFKPTITKLQALDDHSWTRIFDWTPGAWQTHDPYTSEDSVLSHPTIFACQTRIAQDISKIEPIIQRRSNKLWERVVGHRLEVLLAKPNDYQNRIQFLESWMLSKLTHGNTYCLKVRQGGRITELHVLDPLKVTPLTADNGDTFYRLKHDKLSGIEEGQVTIPASDIIHDRFNTFYHPLVGLSPIFAAGLNATGSLKAQKNLKNFFQNGSNPGGILTAPGPISESTATRLKEYWSTKFSGDNAGKIAIAGDGLKFEQMRMSNVDAQVVELLQWTDEKICSVYHVPAYMVGVGDSPNYSNLDTMIQTYYSQCLQSLIEAFELSIDQGLRIDRNHRVQMDVDNNLFRMDNEALLRTLEIGTKSGTLSPNEARERLNRPPVPGGEIPYLQQQNWSLEALSKRDINEDKTMPQPEFDEPEDDDEDMEKLLPLLLKKELEDDDKES